MPPLGRREATQVAQEPGRIGEPEPVGKPPEIGDDEADEILVELMFPRQLRQDLVDPILRPAAARQHREQVQLLVKGMARQVLGQEAH